MPKLSYLIGYLDLRLSIDEIFNNIKTRTEIRKAEKSGVSIKFFSGNASSEIIADCQKILKNLLSHEYVPYSSGYDKLMAAPENYLLVAYREEIIVSFILILPFANNQFFANYKTAFLGLSATDDKEKNNCPNYLLIWKAINFLKDQKFIYFNLGLLNYIDSTDNTGIDRVGFFKRKWNVVELTVEEPCSWGKYVYYRYFKRYTIIKKALYLIKSILS